MEDNAFSLPMHRQPPRLESLWLPLLLPFLLFFIDAYCIPWAFTFPLLLFGLLCYLAFRLPAWMVAFWVAIYAAVIFMVSLLPIREVQTLPEVMPYLRTIYFIVSGTTATLLASHRWRLEKSHEALFSVISVLPLAV